MFNKDDCNMQMIPNCGGRAIETDYEYQTPTSFESISDNGAEVIKKIAMWNTLP